jgi:ABC-type transport system substrate-binding protein
MARIDWSVLSGPYVSRRTLLNLAFGTGAAGFAGWMTAQNRALAARRPAARPGAQEARSGGTLRLGFGLSQIPTLDPAQVNLGIVAGELIPNIFSGLVQFDQELALIPDLAETWEVGEDGLTYTFVLRDGLTFHNGDPLRAGDVVYTYERTTTLTSPRPTPTSSNPFRPSRPPTTGRSSSPSPRRSPRSSPWPAAGDPAGR